MTRISFDIDPRVLSKLRALANRRGVTVDVVVGEFLAAAIRSPTTKRAEPTGSRSDAPRVHQPFGAIDVEYPDDDNDSIAPDNDSND